MREEEFDESGSFFSRGGTDSCIAMPSKSSVVPFGKLLENLTKLLGEISLEMSVSTFPSA